MWYAAEHEEVRRCQFKEVPNAQAAREWFQHDLHKSGVTGKDPDRDAEIIEAVLDEWKSLSKCVWAPLATETKWEVGEDTGKPQKMERCPGWAAPL